MYQRTPKSTAAATLFPSPRRCLSVWSAESRPPPQGNFSQFFWLWTPCNFAGRSLFFHSNDDGEGSPWNRRAVIVGDGGVERHFDGATFAATGESGTRRLARPRVAPGARRTERQGGREGKEWVVVGKMRWRRN